MRINDVNQTPLPQSPEKTDQAAGVQRSATSGRDTGSGSISGADQAEVSPLAKVLTASDPARIESLRAAVQSGNYNISAEAVAGAIVDAHLSE
jgi:flagellar biosynthesis anti-sigma factor FlgM